MEHEINKPVAPTFWRAHGPDATHEGVTEPGQVTTTGQPNLLHSTDPGEFAGMVANSGAMVTPMPLEGEEVTRGKVYDNNGTAYVCVQDHTRTADDPDTIPALFTPARAQLAGWVQPTGAQDAYQMGDRVTFEGVGYESTIDANVWSPTAYPQGWSQL